MSMWGLARSSRLGGFFVVPSVQIPVEVDMIEEAVADCVDKCLVTMFVMISLMFLRQMKLHIFDELIKNKKRKKKGLGCNKKRLA